MSKVIIGSAGGKNIGFDLDLLLPTRLLLTADSGGGKSWVIRVLLEQLFGKVQTITIDPEGEFATLREKFPFVLVGKGGETPADPRSAALLARRLLELRASAVCDLYECKPHIRHAWVKAFIEGLLEVPKDLRTPCVVVVDEAHIYCPEKGKGESEASGAMIDLCTRGRKRGLCAVWATQRLAAVNKDASSMLQNRLIGPTFEDVNRKRAAEMLGIEPGAHTRAFFDEIKLLEPGNFFALGRAISRERILVHIRDVQTTHPKAFEKHSAPPPPAPEKIRALLPKLADLPKEAEEKAHTEREFRSEIRSLRAQLATVGKAATAERAQILPNPAEVKRAIAAAVKPMEAFQQIALRQTKAVAKSLAELQVQLEKILSGAVGALDRIADAAANTSSSQAAASSPTALPSRPSVAVRLSPVVVLPVRSEGGSSSPAESNGQVTAKAERAILSVRLPLSDETSIEWTDATWNPIRGCSRVSQGCTRCYAERIAARFSEAGQPYEGLATMTPSGPRWTAEICITCGCPPGGTVLDPFCGRGTTGLIATRMGRNFIGIELSPQHAKEAKDWINSDAPLFNPSTQIATAESPTTGELFA